MILKKSVPPLIPNGINLIDCHIEGLPTLYSSMNLRRIARVSGDSVLGVR